MATVLDSAEVRAQLERILGSEGFATAGRHSRLLRYLVERTLVGEGEQLKEYVLGTEVFDRPDSYDPRLDSIVRVEVRRLRSRLEDYYSGVGVADPVLITIPRGGYVPVFEERDLGGVPNASPTTSASAAVMRDRRALRPFAIVATVLGVVIVIVAAGIARNGPHAPARAASGPGIAVLPFEHYSTKQQEVLLVARITDAVTAELAKLGTVSVASRTSAAQYTGGATSVVEIATALNVDFVIEASVVFTDQRLRVVARLVDGRRDRKVWVGEYDLQPSDVAAVSRRIAAEASAAALR
jgi:TolB-like protein